MAAFWGECTAEKITGAEITSSAQHHSFGKLPISQHERMDHDVFKQLTLSRNPARQLYPSALRYEIRWYIRGVMADRLIASKTAEQHFATLLAHYRYALGATANLGGRTKYRQLLLELINL